jgi:hypothetical protein
MRAIWMPDGKSLLVSGHDGTRTAIWIQPLDDFVDTGRPVTFYRARPYSAWAALEPNGLMDRALFRELPVIPGHNKGRIVRRIGAQC